MRTRVLFWRIYYSHGARYDSAMGLPESSPPLDVQGVLWHDPRPPLGKKYVQRLVGADWYVYRPDLAQWFKCDTYGMQDQVIHFPGCVVRPGRAIGAREYDTLLKRLVDDPDFQEAGYSVDEQREAQDRKT